MKTKPIPVETKPILMSAPMVRALLEGRKTQTRRVIKPQPTAGKIIGDCIWCYSGWSIQEPNGACVCDEVKCPYGQPGDLLWVRETWSILGDGALENMSTFEYEKYSSDHKPYLNPYYTCVYAADGVSYPKRERVPVFRSTNGWRPSIFMPRWASRLTLELTDVRVERLCNISEADVMAEGAKTKNGIHVRNYKQIPGQVFWFGENGEYPQATPQKAYEKLWQSINGKDSWEQNPWVWVLSFNVHQCNVDDFMKAGIE